MGEVGAAPLRDTPNFPSTPPALVHLQEGLVGKGYGGPRNSVESSPTCHGAAAVANVAQGQGRGEQPADCF